MITTAVPVVLHLINAWLFLRKVPAVQEPHGWLQWAARFHWLHTAVLLTSSRPVASAPPVSMVLLYIHQRWPSCCTKLFCMDIGIVPSPAA
jgi:hypothetical protein